MQSKILRKLVRWFVVLGARLSWLAMLPRLPTQRTSITDNGWWSDLCARNASDDRRFMRFRRGIRHRTIVEAAPAGEARAHLERVLRQTPHYLDLFDKFRALDRVGNPHMVEFGPHGWFAPNTVRFIRYLSDCEVAFGNLDGGVVVEIGVGFGAQCKLFFDRFAVGRYVLIDLPGPIMLARRVLTTLLGEDLVARRIVFVATSGAAIPDTLPPGPYDLAISTLAFSECSRAAQRSYVDNVLARARRGYIHHNEISSHFGVQSLDLAEITAALPGKVEREPDDLTYWYGGNQILKWRTDGVGALERRAP